MSSAKKSLDLNKLKQTRYILYYTALISGKNKGNQNI